MITFEQAMTEQRFHPDGCEVSYGMTGMARPRTSVETWRRNGRTQTWKLRPHAWSIPVKYGLHRYGRIEDHDAPDWHVETECPALAEAARWWAAHTGRL